jgi:hypothetical protein
MVQLRCPIYAKEVTLRAYQRPTAAKRVDDRMKLHRHAISCDGRNYTVITLRPGAYARFSDNYYHGTWHILSDWHGARVLGRLLWGLAYQRIPGTLMLIDRLNLDPSPFSGEPAHPIALVPSQLTTLSEQAARDLRARLPLTRPTGTAEPLIWERAAAIRRRGLRRRIPPRGQPAGPPADRRQALVRRRG